MQTIFINGNIHTMDKIQPLVESLYVENEFIIDCGESEKIFKKYKSSATEIIDLKGKTIIPGFNDSHLHLYQYALKNNKIDLRNSKSFMDIKESINKYIEELNPADSIQISKNKEKKTKDVSIWIEGFGWHEKNFIEPFIMDRTMLDRITKRYPVILKRVCYHLAVVNSTALKMAGIRKNTPDPAGGRIGRFKDGRPNGILYDAAISLVENQIAEKNKREIKSLLKSAFNTAVSFGLTSLQTDDFLNITDKERILTVYQDLRSNGELPLRVNLQLRLESRSEIEEFAKNGFLTGRGDTYLKYGPVKFILDGSLGARTAALIDGYQDMPQNMGDLLYSQSDFYKLIQLTHQSGFQIAVHAIGDAALKSSITTIKKVFQEKPAEDARPVIIHAQIANMKLFKEMSKYRIIASIQPSFLATDWPIVYNRIGEKRAETSYAWKTMLDKGIILTGSSDAPIEPLNPILAIYTAVSRKDLEGKPHMGWYPEEKLSVYEAVQLYTTNAAYQSFEENIKGTLSKNKLADFIVLNEDIFTLEGDKIKEIQVEETYLGGRLVYQKK